MQTITENVQHWESWNGFQYGEVDFIARMAFISRLIVRVNFLKRGSRLMKL